jgi:hypothetical protein
LSLTEQEREKRNDRDNGRIVQKYGEIYVYQGRADIAADNEDEVKVVNMRNARLAKPWRKKYQQIMVLFPEDYWKVKAQIRYTFHNLWE